MEAIFDSQGRQVAWLHTDGTIRDQRGATSAFLRGEQIFGSRGQTLGRLHEGNIRDLRGHVVAWVRGAQGGPVKPVPQVPPVPPVPSVRPIPPVASVPPVYPVPSLSWSTQSWDSFIHQ